MNLKQGESYLKNCLNPLKIFRSNRFARNNDVLRQANRINRGASNKYYLHNRKNNKRKNNGNLNIFDDHSFDYLTLLDLFRSHFNYSKLRDPIRRYNTLIRRRESKMFENKNSKYLSRLKDTQTINAILP